MSPKTMMAGVVHALYDSSIRSKTIDIELIENDPDQGKKVLTAVEEGLQTCNSFFMSVAFINQSGLTPLLMTLQELERKNIKGKVLTTNYLSFSEPKALDALEQLKNVEVRMADTSSNAPGFHTKGYVFFQKEWVRMMIGSSNITAGALTRNKEWNVQVRASSKGSLSQSIMDAFETMWDDRKTIPYGDIREEYVRQYEQKRQMQKKEEEERAWVQEAKKLQPNAMQQAFITRLHSLLEQGAHRALLISATGTGKTYASAFAMRELHFKRVLFIVHRELIAKQAKESFERVFQNRTQFGLYTSNEKEDGDYLFTTMQTISRENWMHEFTPDHFDAIIIDEVHRAGSKSYQKIFEYFQPDLWLGMSATPERTDDFDIYALFDHNIAYEIRLNQALEADLLCPFHYFGIHDLLVDAQENELSDFRYLTCDERIDHIIRQANYYGFSGNRVKGLIFVSRVEEGKELSEKFNARGFRTVALSGSDPHDYRERCIERLSSDAREDRLDYIFTVEIFNEGIDIPSINQVIMLRPTESPIIFVQQMGRGLRKNKEKEFVVILDFIGNYQNNYMIPIALSSDRTYNKDTLRRFVHEGERLLPGSSTIHFDEVSKKEIFKAIDTANLQTLKLIKESYTDLKQKLGRIPTLIQFDEFGSIDPLKIIDHSGSYPAFLQKYEKDRQYNLPQLDDRQLKILEYISKKFAAGKRIHELLLLEEILNNETDLFEGLQDRLIKEYEIELDQNTKENLTNLFTNNFIAGTGRNTYSDCILIQEQEGAYEVDPTVFKLFQEDYFRSCVEQVVQFGMERYRKIYAKHPSNAPFALYEKYTYDDVCRLLNWEKGEVALNIGGYKYDPKTKTFPVFINYKKDENISETIRYEDRFESPSLLKAISKSKRTLESEDVQKMLHAKEQGIEMFLFVRRNKDDKQSKEFYYLGKIFATGNVEKIKVGKEDAVEIEYELETPVRQDIYDYIVR